MANSNSTKPASIVAVLLSGGAGRRFGGMDKGLQIYRGKPLMEHVIKSLTPQVDDFVLCINRNYHRYAEYGYHIVTDTENSLDEEGSTEGIDIKDSIYQGPMAGVVAAARYIDKSVWSKQPNFIALSSCDSPNLPSDLIARLLAKIEASKKSVAVAHDGERRQNLHCLIRVEALDSLQHFYQNDGRAMHRWFQEIGAIDVDFSDQPRSFKNINTPEQMTD